MNVDRKIVSAVAFAAALALRAGPLAAAADENPSATVVPSDYCNMKIPAPNNDKASGNSEDQMTPQWEDWIDYSGPCDQANIEDAVREMKQTSPDD